MQLIFRFLRNQQGVAAIEMAIAFPIILWLVCAIIEFGILFHISSLANYACTEAARKGKTLHQYDARDRNRFAYESVRQTMDPWVYNDADFSFEPVSYGTFQDIGVNGIAGSGNRGELVVYKMTLDWHWFTPLMSAMAGSDTFPIKARVLVKNEN